MMYKTCKLIQFSLVLLLFAGCQNQGEQEKLMEKIEQQEKNVSQKISEGAIKKQEVKSLLKLYEKFYRTYPKDTLSAQYLMKAGQNAMHSNMPGKAIHFFDAVEHSFDSTSHYPMAIFMKAFVYDQMRDTAHARIYYKKFVRQFPNHKLAKDARISVQNLGKSLDEIVKNFDGQ